MSDSDGILKQLLARRVPQIVGLYIAATWMTVEIGEWVTEQIGASGSLVFYVFVLMAALLPAVVVIAWNHGAPGRDQWKRGEKWFISANAAMAAVLLIVIFDLSPVGNTAEAQGATIERVLIDEAGKEQVFQVAREGFHKQVSTSFWTQASADSRQPVRWESYAIAWLIGLDLNRDPLLSIESPFDQDYFQDLREAGFERISGEPLSLALQIAREQRSEFLIRGSYESSESGYRLTARIYSVGSGRQIVEYVSDGMDLIDTVDQISERISESLVGDLERDPESFVTIALSEAATDNPEALQTLAEGLLSWMLENDYPSAIAQLEAALELDPEFAQAYFWLHAIYRLNGDLASSGEAIRSALRFDYKLDTQALFTLRANGYAVSGEFDKAIRVLDMWTQVHPEAEEAWLTLAQNLLFVGATDKAREALLEAQQIDPDNSIIYLQLANTEELAGNLDLATQLMNEYLEDQPDDENGWLTLANMYLRNGQFDQAREAFERAQFIGSGSLPAELGQIRVEALGGDLNLAERMIDRALSGTYIGIDRAQLLFDKAGLLMQTGQPQRILELLSENDQMLRQSIPPIVFAVNLSELTTAAHRMLGQNQTALELIQNQARNAATPMNYFIQFSELVLLEDMGKLDQASAVFAQISAFFETFDFPGREALLLQAEARVLALQQRYAEASDTIRIAFEQARRTILNQNIPFMDQLQSSLAEYLLADGQIDQARQAVEDLLTAHPNHAEGQFLLARIEQAAGHETAAGQVLERLLRQWQNAEPEYVKYQAALELVNSLSETP